MKKAILLLIPFTIVFSAYSQDDDIETLFGRGTEIKISGFGGPMMTFSSFDNNFAHMMGGGGGVLINDFFIGGYGMGLTNNIFYKNDPEHHYVSFGHGGFWLGYNFASERLIHPTLHVQLGWGDIGKSYDDPGNYSDGSENPVFVIAPSIELEVNITRFFKLGVGGSYRYVSLLRNSVYTTNDISDFGVMLSFKFGWF